MAFCVKCGAQIVEGAAICQNCGAPTNNPAAATYMAPVDMTDHTAQMEPQEIERGRVLSALCYCGIAFMILALVAEPNNRYVRFHVNQALSLTIAQFLLMLCMIIPFLGWLVAGLASIVLLVFTIMGIVNGLKRRAKELPIVGKYNVVSY